jgi:hypothetical protein
VSAVFENIDFCKRTDKLFFDAIRCFHYVGAEFILDAYEDFLKGPDFFIDFDPEKVIKEHLSKNEKMRPLEDFQLNMDLKGLYDVVPLNDNDMSLYKQSNNGHELPDYLLNDDEMVPAIHYILFESPGKQFLRKKLLFVNPHNKMAVMRHMDKIKYRELMERYNILMERYKAESAELSDEYRKYAETFYSGEFWNKYLRLEV